MGAWFSTKDLTGATAQRVSMPVFLNIQNPKLHDSVSWLAERAIPLAGDAASYRGELEDDGRDGLTVEDEEFGGTSFVAFAPAQIKSATGNTGAFDGANSDIRFSRQGQTGGIGRATAPQRPAAPPPVNPWQKANAKAAAILSPENIDRVIYGMQDKFIDLKRLRDHIKAIGGVITDHRGRLEP